MFNIGPIELVVILLVALLVVGPKRLPEVGRSIGKSLRELRRATDEVKYSFNQSLDEEEEGNLSGNGSVPAEQRGQASTEDPPA